MSGWKTYAAALIGIAIEGASALGYITPEQARTLEALCGFLGLAALRAGVKKVEEPKA